MVPEARPRARARVAWVAASLALFRRSKRIPQGGCCTVGEAVRTRTGRGRARIAQGLAACTRPCTDAAGGNRFSRAHTRTPVQDSTWAAADLDDPHRGGIVAVRSGGSDLGQRHNRAVLGELEGRSGCREMDVRRCGPANRLVRMYDLVLWWVVASLLHQYGGVALRICFFEIV